MEPGARRDHLIQTAMTVFGEQGIAETSVLQLTRAADISNGTFYRYFDDKEQLEYVIGAIVLEELGQTLEEMQRDLDGAERIAIGAVRRDENGRRKPRSRCDPDPVLRKGKRHPPGSGSAARRAYVREGRESGEFPVDAPGSAPRRSDHRNARSGGRDRSWPGRNRTTSVSS